MHIFKKASDVTSYINHLLSKGQKVGFVPTMGALHNGHLALAELAIAENDVAIASIFVNPTQFNESNDFQRYPRTISNDIARLESIGCQVLFLPHEKEVYPDPSYKEQQFNFGPIASIMEGAERPGHFQGVAQVISRLLTIIPASSIYLGQKDFQQIKIISSVIDNYLQTDTKVRICPIVRETDGLAMSSRNVLLSEEERKDALCLYQNLKWARNQIGHLTPAEVKQKAVESMTLTATLEQVEYFEIVNAETLQPITDWSDANAIVACTAARFPSARLIDNMYLKGAPY